MVDDKLRLLACLLDTAPINWAEQAREAAASEAELFKIVSIKHALNKAWRSMTNKQLIKIFTGKYPTNFLLSIPLYNKLRRLKACEQYLKTMPYDNEIELTHYKED